MRRDRRRAQRAIAVTELLLSVERPRRGGRFAVTVENAEPRDQRFFRALAELVGAWFNRCSRRCR